MLEKVRKYFNDILGSQHEVSESIKEALHERFVSPFYGYFLLSWFVVNWDYVYSAFFVDGEYIYEKTGLLKNEYLLQTILPSHYSFPEYWLQFIVYPSLLTFCVFWVMPVITHKFYQKHIRNKIQMESILIKETTVNIKAESELLKAEVEQAEISKKAESVSPELVWKKEYNEFKLLPIYEKFKDIEESVYEHNGLIKEYDYTNNDFGEMVDQELVFKIDNDILVYADSNHLIEIDRKEGRIQLKEKGKFFVKLYSLDKQKKTWETI